MKLVTYLFLALVNVAPVVSLAQDDIQGASSGTFVNSMPLWIAVGIGFIATFLVFRNAQKIGGGVLGKVYYHFGTGMFLVVLGFLAVVVPPWASEVIIMRTHDALFVMGYLIMAFGAQKILAVSEVK